MIGDPEDVDYAALELDDEQRIELGEPDGVHDEEVGRQDAARLGGEELLPGSTARSWSETVTSKYSADRACRDADPESAELALNADNSPARVLPAETDDELDDLITKWRPSWTSQGSPSLPFATRELPMPAEQSLGRDEVAQADGHGRGCSTMPKSASSAVRSMNWCPTALAQAQRRPVGLDFLRLSEPSTRSPARPSLLQRRMCLLPAASWRDSVGDLWSALPSALNRTPRPKFPPAFQQSPATTWSFASGRG
jgi:hypothetical protein